MVKKKVRPFTEVEFLLALGIFIGAAEFGVQGANLWKEGDKVGSELEEWPSMIPHPEFDEVMKLYRWKEFRHFYLSFINTSISNKKTTRGGNLTVQSRLLIIIVMTKCKSLSGCVLMKQCVPGDQGLPQLVDCQIFPLF